MNQAVYYAFLSALFAALTTILAKIGIKEVNSDLATAIRTIVILFFAWGMVFVQGQQKGLGSISRHTLIFLVLSGVATGMSWLFYFRAIQMGEVKIVAPIDKFSLVLTIVLAAIILGERITVPVGLGVLLISLGTIIIAVAK